MRICTIESNCWILLESSDLCTAFGNFFVLDAKAQAAKIDVATSAWLRIIRLSLHL